ncbi:hypothetical protein V6N13_145691 [Hibiscus sabdariffa]
MQLSPAVTSYHGDAVVVTRSRYHGDSVMVAEESVNGGGWMRDECWLEVAWKEINEKDPIHVADQYSAIDKAVFPVLQSHEFKAYQNRGVSNCKSSCKLTCGSKAIGC